MSMAPWPDSVCHACAPVHGTVSDHHIPHVTPAGAQNRSNIVVIWQVVVPGQVPVAGQVLAHPAKSWPFSMQAKQLVPDAHGCPQSVSKLMHLPATQRTAACAADMSLEPSSLSVREQVAQHGQAGVFVTHCCSS